MSIKKFSRKDLRPGMTDKKKGAIIETKEKYCYPQYGKTVEAKNKVEADKEIKKFIK